MRRCPRAALLALVAAVPCGLRAEEPGAAEIVRRADEIRNPALSYTVEVRISNQRPGRPEEISFYRVFVKGRDRAFVEFLDPGQQRGVALLMAGEDSWLYLPSIGRATRVSSYQGLTGNVTNGDIARLNFREDYEATRSVEEDLDGRPTYRVDLQARRRSATYHRVVLWVERETYRPLKADFYVVSGRLLKRGEYGEYREVLGAMRPTRLLLEDATAGSARSVLDFSNFRQTELPERMFTRSHISQPR